MKIILGILVALALLAGGYWYMSGGMQKTEGDDAAMEEGAQASGSVDEAIAAFLGAAEAEATVANDDGALAAVEADSSALSASDVYVQGEF